MTPEDIDNLPKLPQDTPLDQIPDGEYFLHDGPSYPDPQMGGLPSHWRRERIVADESERQFKVVVIKGGKIAAFRYSISGALYILPRNPDLPVDFPAIDLPD